MLTFRQFINEALDFKAGPGMKNTGTDAARHVASYVVPYIDSGEDTHTIKTAHKLRVPGQKKMQVVLSKGQNVQIHGYHVDETGNHHVIVSSSGGPKYQIPFSKVHRLSLASSWNDELATEHMWNFAVEHDVRGRNVPLHEHLLDNIKQAKSDPNHPLSFERVRDRGFSGGKKQERHRAAYYAELVDASSSVDKMVTEPTIKGAFESKWKADSPKWIASPAGTGRGIISKLWRDHGVDQSSPAAISKSDLIIHPEGNITHPASIKISMKRGGGSQLISSGPEEFGALHEHAAMEEFKDHPQKEQHVATIMDHVTQIKDAMNAARGKDRDTIIQLARQANRQYGELIEKYPGLNKHVRYEGATGNAKFDTHEHRATYMLTGATRKDRAKIDRLDDSWRNKQADGTFGAITVGKREGASLAFRVRS